MARLLLAILLLFSAQAYAFSRAPATSSRLVLPLGQGRFRDHHDSTDLFATDDKAAFVAERAVARGGHGRGIVSMQNFCAGDECRFGRPMKLRLTEASRASGRFAARWRVQKFSFLPFEFGTI